MPVRIDDVTKQAACVPLCDNNSDVVAQHSLKRPPGYTWRIFGLSLKSRVCWTPASCSSQVMGMWSRWFMSKWEKWTWEPVKRRGGESERSGGQTVTAQATWAVCKDLCCKSCPFSLQVFFLFASSQIDNCLKSIDRRQLWLWLFSRARTC